MSNIKSLFESLESRRFLSVTPTDLAGGGPVTNPVGPGHVIIGDLNTNTAGQLDPSFGTGGKTTVDFDGLGVEAYAVATQADGKTVEVGSASDSNGNSEFAIVRLNFNGTPDTTFGPNHNGIVLLPVNGTGINRAAEAVAIDGQGRIVVAGSDNVLAYDSGNVGSDIYVARFLPNGTLDQSFGSHGVADVHFGFHNASDCGGIALQNDGKIVVVGMNKGFFNNIFGAGNVDFAVARLNSNGSLDSSFNGGLFSGGTETVGFNGVDAIAQAVTIDYSGTPATNPHYGTILVSGYTDNKSLGNESGSVSHMAVVRLKPNGGIDSSFNGNGEIEFEPKGFSGGASSGVVVQSTGDIVVSGTLGKFAYDNGIDDGQFTLVRLLPNGKTDATFSNGQVYDTVSADGADYADSLLLGPDDRLIVGGSAGGNTALAGFTANGKLDNTFGSGGIVTTNFGADTEAAGLAYLGDRIVAVGGGMFQTARYIDTSPNVAIGTFDITATPQSPATFIVGRGQDLPYDTQVNLSISGTATGPSLFAQLHHDADYTLSGVTLPGDSILGQAPSTPFVDIPAGQSYVLVTLTPLAGSPLVGTATATFTLTPSTFYNISTPSSVTINVTKPSSAPTTLGDTADAYVQDGANANTNFGSSPSLVVKTGSVGLNRYTYLKFDLSGVSTINSAELQLNGQLSNAANSSVTTDVYSVANTSWTEGGITFNNAPPAGSSPLASATITGTTQHEYTWNVTAYLQAQKAAGNNIVSLVLEDPASSSSAVIFNAREAGNGPTLQIS